MPIPPLSRRARGVARAVAALLVAAMALTACTTVTPGIGSRASGPMPTATTTPATVGTVDFTNCGGLFDLSAAGVPADRARYLTFSCGKVSVPLDYGQPAGGKISLFLLKVHDRRSTGQRPLLINPGGPGASGVLTAVQLAATIDAPILSSFDIIGFDPRGVGLSSHLSCATDTVKDALFEADPDVRTAAGLAAAQSLYSQFTSGCVRTYGPALADYNTVETARDMETLRVALGNGALNYLGYSYGTLLGAVYASLYPKQIRTAVLDGAVDPSASDLSLAEGQAAGFEQAFSDFAANCATQPACAPLGDPRTAVAQLLATAAATGGIASSATADPRRATGGLILSGVAAALYDQRLWSTLGAAILAAERGDAKGLIALSDQYYQRGPDGKYTNLWDANTAILCNDARQTFASAQIQQIAIDWGAKYPLFGVYFASQLFQCTGWPPSGQPVPTTVTATGSKPIVVIGTVHDPATPYAGAAVLASALGTGVLLSWNGEGHTAYGKSPCVDKLVDAYFIHLTVPTTSTTCPAK